MWGEPMDGEVNASLTGHVACPLVCFEPCPPSGKRLAALLPWLSLYFLLSVLGCWES